MCKSLLAAPFKFAAKAQNRFDPVTKMLQKQGYAGNGIDPAHWLNAKLGGTETDTALKARTMYNPNKPKAGEGSGLSIAGRRGAQPPTS